MPEVVFYALGGRSVEQKRALIKDFTDAVVKNYKVDASAVTITIVESSKEDKAKAASCSATWGRRRVERARRTRPLRRSRPRHCSII
jgi:4-oxalocrotonate tautomerase